MIEDSMPMGIQPGQPNADDQNQIQVATIQMKRREQREAEDLAWVLSTEHGRRFVTRIIQLTGVHAISDPDPVLVQRSEGARSVGLEVLRLLGSHSVTTYPNMLMEAALLAEHDKKERDIALVEHEKAQERGVPPWLDSRPLDPTDAQ